MSQAFSDISHECATTRLATEKIEPHNARALTTQQYQSISPWTFAAYENHVILLFPVSVRHWAGSNFFWSNVIFDELDGADERIGGFRSSFQFAGLLILRKSKLGSTEDTAVCTGVETSKHCYLAQCRTQERCLFRRLHCRVLYLSWGLIVGLATVALDRTQDFHRKFLEALGASYSLFDLFTKSTA